MHDRGWWAGIALAWVLGISWLAIDSQRPPAALAVDAPDGMFSAGRAQRHVVEIARAPHPTGSAEAERVRKVLLKELAQLALEPQVQTPRDLDSQVRNVLARLPGQGPPGKKALMLCAHYDSVATGPGAGDNASGVAVMLETLRALKAGPPLDRDVIVLFDDGEEDGLLGALVFVEEHPWAREVGVVINVDARGNSGPSMMFETSDENGWLIHEYSQAVLHPLATSASVDVYHMFPNSTDLTVFKQAGMAGLNFAFSAGLVYYHTPEDTAENLDPRTLQHQGENVLAMARRLGQRDLDAPKHADLIYTSILGRFVLSYPMSWALPLAVTTAFFFLAVLVIGLRTERVRLDDVAVGASMVLVAMGVSLLASGLLFGLGFLWNVLGIVFYGIRVPWLKFDVPILTGCAILTATVTLAVKGWTTEARSLLAFSLGALSWWVALTLISALWLPGGSYLFVWPSIFGVLSLGFSIGARQVTAVSRTVTLGCATPVLVLFPPLLRNMFEALSLDFAAPGMILVVLFLGSMLPAFEPLIVRMPSWQYAHAKVPQARTCTPQT
ncbi:MAG: M20/M25/M40 family metallo-hydrolase [Isosphaeraceae bacterium]